MLGCLAVNKKKRQKEYLNTTAVPLYRGTRGVTP